MITKNPIIYKLNQILYNVLLNGYLYCIDLVIYNKYSYYVFSNRQKFEFESSINENA